MHETPRGTYGGVCPHASGGRHTIRGFSVRLLWFGRRISNQSFPSSSGKDLSRFWASWAKYEVMQISQRSVGVNDVHEHMAMALQEGMANNIPV